MESWAKIISFLMMSMLTLSAELRPIVSLSITFFVGKLVEERQPFHFLSVLEHLVWDFLTNPGLNLVQYFLLILAEVFLEQIILLLVLKLLGLGVRLTLQSGWLFLMETSYRSSLL